MAALRFALRNLLRDLKSGELAVLLLALLVAVGSLTAVGFFTSRIGRAVAQQAGEVLAADLRLESARPVTEDYESATGRNTPAGHPWAYAASQPPPAAKRSAAEKRTS